MLQMRVLSLLICMQMLLPSGGGIFVHQEPVAVGAGGIYSHAIVMDGKQDFYDSLNAPRTSNETFSTSSSGVFSYLTWDANHLYFAYQADDVRSNVSQAGNKWIWLYIGGAGGTTTGLEYAGQQPQLPFAAKYHVRFRVDGSYTNRQMWNGVAWKDMGNYAGGSNVARDDSNRYVEFKLPRAHFGLETASRLQIVAALVYEDQAGANDAMWGAVPYDAFGEQGDGYDRDFQKHYEFDLTASNAAASQAYDYSLVVAEQRSDQVRIGFHAAPGASQVRLEQSEDGGVSWRAAKTEQVVTESTRVAKVAGLLAGDAYGFRLKVSGGEMAGQSVPVYLRLPQAGYRHTILLDGVNDFYTNRQVGQNETFATSSGYVFANVTWDDEFLYFGYHAKDIVSTSTNAASKWLWLYIGGAGGTTSGLEYAGQQPQLPFAAKYHLRFRVDGSYTNRQMWNGSAWQDMGNYSWGTHVARNDGLEFVEFRLPRKDFSLTDARSLQMVSALVTEDKLGNNDRMSAALPSDAFGAAGNGYDRDFLKAYEFDLQSDVAPASQVFAYELQVQAVDSKSAKLKFAAQSGDSQVWVEQSQDGGATWQKSVLSKPLDETSRVADVTGLAANTRYIFRLRSNSGGVAGGPLAPRHSVTEVSQWITDVATDKARYLPNDKVQVMIELQNPSITAVTGELHVVVAHMERQVAAQSSGALTLPASSNGSTVKQTVTIPITAPTADFKGYRLDVYWQPLNSTFVDYRSGAFDVSSDWTRFPRYGYITDYPAMTEQEVAAVIKRLNRYHINALQYYDWQWKHHIPVKMENGKPAAVWKDIANRDVYSQTIRAYLAEAKQRNMLNMNYNLMFGSYVGAQADGVLPEWGLYKDRNRSEQDVHPLPSTWATDRILIQNPANDGWVNYILQTEKVALEQFGFDGWHIDQLGNRGTLYDYYGNEVAFDDAYGSMLGKIQERLKTRLVMNAVSEYGVQQIAAAPVDVLYTEVWPFPQDRSYSQLKRYVETGLRLGQGKRGQVLAAYMNYQAAEQPGQFNTPAVLLTDAVIMAAGGTHLELGDTGMLGKEYFPNKNLKMSAELEERLKRYYDFQTAYQNLLMDGVQPIDVPVKAVAGETVTAEPQAGAIWSFARQTNGAQVVHFINLSNNATTDWRDDDGNNVTMPTKKTNVKVQLQTEVWPEKVYFMTADGDLRMQEVVPTVSVNRDGKYVLELTIPELLLWSTIVLQDGQSRAGSSAWVATKTDVQAPPPVPIDREAPTAPSGLKVTNVTTSSLRVTWSASKDNVGVTGYNVYRDGAYVFSVATNSATMSGLKPGTTYRIQVLAYDVRMNKSSRSAALTVRTATPLDTVAPTVPNGLVISNVTKSGFRVAWSASKDNVGVTGYNVYRNGVYVATVSGRAMTFSGLKANTLYKIQVLAFDQRMNKSVRSSELQVRTLR